jgi:nucleoside-diphosphate-sugar epimerase
MMSDVAPCHLLHFAWVTDHGQFWTSDLNLDWVRASIYLLQEFIAHGGVRVVMAGTCAEYSWTDGPVCLEDETPLTPATLYGASKNALRLMMEAYCQKKNVSSAWGRIFSVYGPGETSDRLVPMSIQALNDNVAPLIKEGGNVRDYLYSVDLAQAFVALLDSDVTGVVNLASGEPVRLDELVRHLAEGMGKLSILANDAGFAHASKQTGNPSTLVADTKRLRNLVNWQPKYTLSEGLAQTVSEWFQRDRVGLQ